MYGFVTVHLYYTDWLLQICIKYSVDECWFQQVRQRVNVVTDGSSTIFLSVDYAREF